MQEKTTATAIAILATIALVTTTAIPSIGSLTTQPDDEPWLPTYTPLEDRTNENGTYLYTWDGPLPTSDYRRIETLTLPSLPDTPVEVVVETVDLFAEESNMTSLPTDDPAVDDRETVGVALEGKVNGHPYNRADLVITSYGVYGLIHLDGLRLDYTPQEVTNGTWIQSVGLDPTAGVSPDALLGEPVAATDASEVSIVATQRMTPLPIEADQPFDVAIAVENAGNGSVHALIEATATADGDEVAREFVGPFKIVADDVGVRNVTMDLPQGTYNLTYQLHTVEHAIRQAPLDQATETMEISRPLDAAPEAYVLAFGDEGERHGEGAEVAISPGTVDIRTAPTVDHLLVHQAWLVDKLGSVTADTRWTSVSYQEEAWVRIGVPDTDQPVTFTTFELTTEPVFTTGAPDAIQFTQRPMWLSLDEATTRDTMDPHATNESSHRPVLGLQIEDTNHDGQPIQIDKDWLREHGIDHARYGYPNGEDIPVQRALDHDFILPPHFSIVMIEDFECPTDCTQGSPPDTNWIDETTCCGTWEVSATHFEGLNGVEAQGGSLDDHKFAHRDIATIAEPELTYWAHIGSDDGDPDWHKLQWRDNGNRAIEINIRTDGSGNLEVTTPTTSGWVSTPFNTTEWLPVRAFNIDWSPSPCTFDVQVGHKVVLTNVAFPVCKSSVDELRIGSKGWGAEAWWVDAISYHDGNLVQSNLQFDISDAVTDEHNDYSQRVMNTFHTYDQLWEQAPMYIDLEIEHIHPRGVNIIDTDCDGRITPVQQYDNWLSNSSLRTDDSVDAYQWWTAYDIENEGIRDCYGQAKSNTVKEGSKAVSVMEGVEQGLLNPDRYDSDSSRDRGLVSGHELAHVYGQEGHIHACESTCNLMDEWGDTDFWFSGYTEVEIWTEFYFDEEWDGITPP